MGDIGVSPVTQVQEFLQPNSSSQPFQPSKPLLPRMIKVYQSLSETGDKAIHQRIDVLEREQGETELCSKKYLDQIEAKVNQTWVEKTWSSLDFLIKSVGAVLNFVAGTYLIVFRKEASSGICLVGAGIFNILQTFFSQQGMWDWISQTLAEKNQDLRDRLKLVLPLVCFFFNLAFSSLSYKGYSLLTEHKNLITILQLLQSQLSTLTQVGNSVFSIEKGVSEARFLGIQGELKYHEQKTDLFSRLVEDTLQHMRMIKKTIKKPITSLMQATTLASKA